MPEPAQSRRRRSLEPWYYAVGVADDPSSNGLLKAVNQFIAWFKGQSAWAEIELRWPGEIVAGRMTYRDEPGNLKGEAELARSLARSLA